MACNNPQVSHESLLPSENGDKAKPVKAAMTPDSTIESLKSLAIAKLPYIRYAFRSVNDGVKLVAQFTKDITNERDYCKIYVFLAMQIEWALKRICDNTHDPARACFLSYDPALLINHQVKPLDPRVTLKQADEVMKLSFPRRQESMSPSQAQESFSPNLTPHSCESRNLTQLREIPDQVRDEGVCGVPANANSPLQNVASASDGTDYAKAEKAVLGLSKLVIDYYDWIKIGQSLFAGFGQDGKALWDMFMDNPNYNDDQRLINLKWFSFRNVRSITLATLFYMAEKYGVSYE